MEWKKKLPHPMKETKETDLERKKPILSERKSGDAATILMFCNLMFVIKMFKWLIFLYPTFHFNIFFMYPTQDMLFFQLPHHFLFSPHPCHK